MISSETDLNYQQVFKNAPTALVVIAADEKFTITAVSDVYLRVTMTREEDILGKGMFEVFPGNPDTPEATGVDQLRSSLQDVIKKATIQTMPVVKYDIRRPDGTYEERFWSATHTPLFDGNGDVTHILQHTEDVTHIMRLQKREVENTEHNRRLQIRTNQVEAEVVKRVEELEEAYRNIEKSERKLRSLGEEAIIKQNRYSAAVEATGQLLYDWDPVSNEIWYEGDTQKLLGYTLDEMKGGLNRFLDLVHPDDKMVFKKEIERVLVTGDSALVEVRVARNDGSFIYCESRGQFFRDASGKRLRMVGFMRDTTARRENEQALRHNQERLEELNLALEQARDEAVAASAAKSIFLATMSHELRTPLNAVIGYSELLKEAAEQGTLSTPALVDDLERISSSGEHLLTLISDILDFSKIEAGRMELTYEMIDLQQLLDDAAVAITPQNAARGNYLTVCGPGSGTLVIGDYTRLKQVLINLLGNAAKFTTGGRVTVEGLLCNGKGASENGTGESRQAPGASLMLRVRDTGIGISADNIHNLFQSFRQLDASRARQHGGTGLGLAITKRLVELMGGTITVDSEIGDGTTFTVTIPQP